MILRHGRCLGLRLFRWGRKQLEVWFAPMDERIEGHCHTQFDSKIVLIFGRAWGWNGSKTGNLKKFKVYDVPTQCWHSAYVFNSCVFFNLETWTGDKPMSSACVDFEV